MALTRITTGIIADNTLAVANIADNAVDATKIASNSILTRHIDDDQITGAQLADNIDIVGTLDVTGATVLDSTLGVTGVLTANAGIQIDALNLDGRTIASTDANGNINISPHGTGTTVIAGNTTVGGTLGVAGNVTTGNSLILGGNDNEEALLTIRYSTVPGYISSTYDGTSAITAFSTNQYNNDDASASVSSIVNSSYAAAAIKMYADTADSSIRFYTATAANTTPTEYMRVDHDGKVGIGTTDPNRTLTVYGSSNGEMNLKNSSADFLIQQAGHNTSIGNSSSSGYINFFTNNGNANVRMLANGNVGIGVAPASHYGFGRTLEVQGSANAEINLSQTDNSKNWSMGIVNGSNYQQTDNSNYVWESGGVERMRIDGSGNVGIGVAPSYAKMHIIGGSSGSGDFDALAIHHENTTTTGDGPVIRFEGEYNNAVWALAEMKATNGGAGFGADFQIKTHPGGGTQGSNVLPAFFLKRIASNILQAGLHAGGATTYADDASTTISGICNTSALIFIQSQRKAGGNSVSYDAALFFAHYGIDSGASVVELADPGGTFAPSESDGFVCVYKGNNTANVTVKNMLGYSTGISVVVMPILGN